MADIFDSDDDDVLNKPEATKASNKSKLPIYSSDEDDVIAPTTKDDTAGVSKPNLLAFLSDDEDDDAEPQPVSAAVTDDAKPIKSIFGDDLSEDEDDNKMEVVDSDNSSVKKVSKKSKSLGKSSQAKKAVVDSDNEQDLFNSDGEDLDEETEAQQVEKKNEALNQMLGAAKPEESILQTRVVEMEVGQRHGVPTGARKMFAKMPNFLRCQHQAYSKNSYDEAAETIAFTGATAIIRCMKKGDQMLSNARIVKWDDGSFQLVVANEVYNMRINPVDNCYIFEVQQSKVKGGDENLETVLECNGVIQDRINIVPVSLNSATHAIMSHQLIKNASTKKGSSIVVQDFDKMVNPDKTMRELVKQEDEEIRKKMRAIQKEKRHNYANTGAGVGRSRGMLSRPGLDVDYIEDGEDGSEVEDDNDSFIDNTNEEEEGSNSDNDDKSDGKTGTKRSSSSDNEKTNKTSSSSKVDDNSQVVEEEEEEYVPQVKKRQKTAMFDDDDE